MGRKTRKLVGSISKFIFYIFKAALMVRAKANSEAQLGTYKGSKDGSGCESLYVAGYKY